MALDIVTLIIVVVLTAAVFVGLAYKCYIPLPKQVDDLIGKVYKDWSTVTDACAEEAKKKESKDKNKN